MTAMVSPVKKPVHEAESKLLAQTMNAKYATHLAGRLFSIAAEEREGALYVTTLLKNSDETYYYPVETRLDYKAEEMGLWDAFVFLVDYLDNYFEEYLTEDDSLFIPIDWTVHQYDAVDFQIKGQIINKKMEDWADTLLVAATPATSSQSDFTEDLGQG